MSAVRVVAFFGMLGAAIGVRALPWREVLEPGGVVFFGNDAWYHARRIAYGFVHFPERLGHDPYLAFPDGAKAIWSPGFDATLAALARIALGEPTDGATLLALERFLVWVPPVLGALTVAGAAIIARRLFGAAEAAWTAAVLCVLPAHFWYTRIGFVDHHAAVAFLSTASVAMAVAWHGAVREGRQAHAIGWMFACGASLACLVWMWPGAVLHVALVEIGLAWALGASVSRADSGRVAWQLAGMNGFAALLLGPLVWSEGWPQWGAWSPLVLSRFQPLAFGCVALAAAAWAGVWRWDAFGATAARRIGSAALVSCCIVAFALGAVPTLGAGIADAGRWLLRDEAFQSLVGESLPLLVQDGAFSLEMAWRRFGPLVFLYPFALAGLAFSVRRHPERGILVAWAVGLFVATLLQRRFFATASVGFAIVVSAGLCRAWRAIGGRARIWRWAGGVAVAAGLLPLFVPYADFVANEWRVRQGEPLRAAPAFGAVRAGVAVADWFGSVTPETDGWMQRDAEPEYGVLAPWHLGHVITYRGRRPTVVDNFGDDLGAENFAWARRIYAAPESVAAPALRERRVRYVVVEADARWLGRSPGRESLLRALYERDGAGDASHPALVHHRLVYETRGVVFTREASARYKVFERVVGALVEGRAPPGSPIQVTLALRTSRGRHFAFAARVVADDEGVYRLRLPYATRGGPAGVHVAAKYRLRCDATEVPLVVEEDAVQAGLAITGPTLCSASLTPPRAPADEHSTSQEGT